MGKIVKIKDKIAPKTLVIGNGDIKNYQEILEKSKTYGVAGVMVGRGIFDNSWLFNKNDNGDHSKAEYISLLKKHFDYFEKEHPLLV